MNHIKSSQLQNNLDRVSTQMMKAAEKSGRQPETIKLIAVTKGQRVETIEYAVELGVTRFGENYPEETVGKIKQLVTISPEIEWHMIGHIQSRKVPMVVDYFSRVHSLDSLHIAEIISKRLADELKTIPVLLEMNLTGEQSKFGFPAWDEKTFKDTLQEISEIVNYKELKISGLMTMPPLSEDPETSRLIYRRLREIQTVLEKTFTSNNWSDLSMGSSFDFEVAIEEGATMVRIGQALFGPRSRN
jgi:pyridoxal phosphate enzyme (YggS family)